MLMRVCVLLAVEGCGAPCSPRGAAEIPEEAVGGTDRVAVGDAHSCVLRQDETVWCWGKNTASQVGRPVSERVLRPQQVPHVSHAVAVSARSDATCALQRGGEVFCWGSLTNSWPVPYADRSQEALSPSLVRGLPPMVQIGVGSTHVCARTEEGEVWCWGNNAVGQIGIRDYDSPEPVQVPMAEPVIDLAVGPAVSCVSTAERRWFCWGNRPEHERLFEVEGWGAASDRPVEVPGLAGMEQIRFGNKSACATRQGSVRCTMRRAHRDPPDGVTFLTIAGHLSGETGCALVGQEVRCWADNAVGQTGVLGPVFLEEPIRVSELDGATALALGPSHGCAVLATGEVVCWGENDFGQRGTGLFGESDVRPRPVLFDPEAFPRIAPLCVPSIAFPVVVNVGDIQVRICMSGTREEPDQPFAEPSLRCWNGSLDEGTFVPASEQTPTPGSEEEPSSFTVTYGGDTFEVCLEDGSCHQVHIPRSQELLRMHDESVSHAVTEDGALLVVVRPDWSTVHEERELGRSGRIYLETYDVQTGRRRARFPLLGEVSLELQEGLHTVGGTVAVDTYSGLLDPLSGEIRVRSEHMRGNGTPIGNSLWVFLGYDRRVRTIHVPTGEVRRVSEMVLEEGEFMRAIDADHVLAIGARSARLRKIDLDQEIVDWTADLPRCRGHLSQN